MASAQPKIQKMCEEESDDHEAVAKLFEINDSIHRTLERYKLIRSGNVEAASQIPRGTLGTSGAGVKKGPDNELSLIDLGSADDSAPQDPNAAAATGQSSGQAQGNSLENDLIGLSLGDNTQNVGGQISLGGPPQQQQANPAASKQNIMNAFNAPPPSYTPQAAQQSVFAQPPPQTQAFPQQPPQYQQPPQQPQPQASLLSSLGSPAPQIQQPTAQQPKPTPDPFAGLSSISSHNTRTPSPFQFQQASTPKPHSQGPSQPPSLSSSALFQPTSQPPPQAFPQQQQPQSNGTSNSNNADDEWTFTSALPPSTPATSDLTVLNTSLNIHFHVSRPPNGGNVILIQSSISNNTPEPITELTFQAAVSKGTTLKMEPQSSRKIDPNTRAGVTQVIRLFGVEQGKGGQVKVRWKVGFMIGGVAREEMGEVANLGIQ